MPTIEADIVVKNPDISIQQLGWHLYCWECDMDLLNLYELPKTKKAAIAIAREHAREHKEFEEEQH